MKKKRKRSRIRRNHISQEMIDRIRRDSRYFILTFIHMANRTKNMGFLPYQHPSGDMTTLCPHHHEKTPSFRIHRWSNTGIYSAKCFGCGKSGDIIFHTMDLRGVSFWKAVKLCLEMIPSPLLYTSSCDPDQLSIHFFEFEENK
jgi:DNA primase